jgi:hypothetical protein
VEEAGAKEPTRRSKEGRRKKKTDTSILRKKQQQHTTIVNWLATSELVHRSITEAIESD